MRISGNTHKTLPNYSDLDYIITNSMEWISYSGTDSSSASQEIPRPLRNPKIHYWCLQEEATGPYHKSDESSPYHPILFL
jgi:hypothetical protein